MYYQILADLNRRLAVREGGEGWYDTWCRKGVGRNGLT